MVALSWETRWISALGPTQLQAYSVGHSACFYMSPLSSLWAGITAKVGRAVGENDDAEISRLLRMTAVLVGGTAALTWVVYLPFGRWLLEDVYEADADVLPDALAYLRIKTLGEWTVEYAADAGGNVQSKHKPAGTPPGPSGSGARTGGASCATLSSSCSRATSI